MSKIPTEQQHLPRDPVLYLEGIIARGNAVSGSDLLDAIEQSLGKKLEDPLRNIVSKFSLPRVKRRGRPRSSDAKIDFAEIDRQFAPLLADEQENGSSRAGSPSERAYERLRNTDDFRSMSCWESLRNEHSAWRKRHQNSLKNPVDSEDFDAEIDRQFPNRKHK